jgi:hypothetical protein
MSERTERTEPKAKRPTADIRQYGVAPHVLGPWVRYEDHLVALGETEQLSGVLRGQLHRVEAQAEAAERELAGLREEVERLKANALESQGAIQPVIGALRMGNALSDELDRLEHCHDFIKRNVDGEDWKAAWAALLDTEAESAEGMGPAEWLRRSDVLAAFPPSKTPSESPDPVPGGDEGGEGSS